MQHALPGDTGVDEHYMLEAIKEAQKAYELDEVPVGAVIVHEHRLVARAHNQMRQLQDPTAHAEMVAITQAANTLGSERLLGATLYVTLEPCSMCAGALVMARISRLVFGAVDPKAGACGSVLDISNHPSLNHRFPVESGCGAEESQALLQQFFQEKRAKNRTTHCSST